jgi:hypothetical protein
LGLDSVQLRGCGDGLRGSRPRLLLLVAEDFVVNRLEACSIGGFVVAQVRAGLEILKQRRRFRTGRVGVNVLGGQQPDRVLNVVQGI